MNKKILNEKIINSIKEYLKKMDWAQKDCKVEELRAFLTGVRYALDKDIMFKVSEEIDENSVRYVVALYEYKDSTNDWAGKSLIAKISSNKTEFF